MIAIVVAVLIIVGLNGSESESPVAGQTVKIGYVGPLTGDAGALGQQQKQVVAYRIEEINTKTAGSGTRFEVVYEDGKCAGAEAVNAFQKLVDVDGAKAIIGGLCSSETLTRQLNILH